MTSVVVRPRRARITSTTMGITDTATIARMATSRWSLSTGNALPRK